MTKTKISPEQEARVFEDLLDSTAVAAMVGTITAATVRSYALRGVMCPPVRHVGRTPLWRRSDIEHWLKNRPGQGVGGGRPKKAGTG